LASGARVARCSAATSRESALDRERGNKKSALVMPGTGGALRVLILAASPAAFGEVEAQVTLTLDAGATSVRYDGFERTNGVSLAPSLRLERENAFVSASGDFARFGGGTSAFGEILGSWFSSPRPWREGAVRLELGGAATTSAYRSAIRNTFLAAHGRLHLGSEMRGGWLGGGTGYLSHTSTHGSTLAADAGAWTRIAGAMLSAHLAASRFPRANPVVPLEYEPLDLGAGNASALLGWSSSKSFETRADLTAALHVPLGRTELDAMAGTRLEGHSGPRRQWASVAASFWLTRNVALTGRAGTYPSRIERGFPSASFASIAVRIASTSRSNRFMPVAPRSRASSLDVRWESSGEATLRVTAQGARRVELRADFTDWRTVPLTQIAAGVWEVRLPLAPGSYRAAIRVDGGVWAPPPGTQGLSDEFGEFVGIILVLP
ncbi:MAG: glycogen-binding domain-containing protein, partial [Gemmatimonadaceae bacterium]